MDLGCGADSPLGRFSVLLSYSLGVERFEPYLVKSQAGKKHAEYLAADILTACRNFKDNSFDCVLALDVIEHFKKEEGLKILIEMERIAAKKVIIYTPNGFLKQKALDANDGQVHLSGWEV